MSVLSSMFFNLDRSSDDFIIVYPFLSVTSSAKGFDGLVELGLVRSVKSNVITLPAGILVIDAANRLD